MLTTFCNDPHPVDVVVGLNVRRLRKARGMSQEKLAEAIDLTFQQVQKYERGHNRISASKLFDIAKALECRIIDLFPPIDWATQVEANASFIDDAQALYIDHPHIFEALADLEPRQVKVILATAAAFKDQASANQVAA